MKEKEDEYSKSIGILTDFNSRTAILASQSAVLSGGAYASSLGPAVNGLLSEYKSFSPISAMLPSLDPSIHSPYTAITREANLAISALTSNENVLGLASIVSQRPGTWLGAMDSMHSLVSGSGLAQTVLSSADRFSLGQSLSSDSIRLAATFADQFKASSLAIESNFSKLSATSILAESSFSAFKVNDLGSQIGITESARISLHNSISAFSQGYSEVFKNLGAAPNSIIDFSPSVIRRTPIEYYTGAELGRLISTPEKTVVEKELLTNKILIDNEQGLAKALPKIDAQLVGLWQGAKQSLESSNPDRIRHFSISMRELMTQVIHHLAPDEKVKDWSSKPQYFVNGRPTREARLLYISRDIDLGGFQKFVRKDVATTIEFINIFQEGTHKVKPSLTERQLLAMKAKVESTVNFLIEIGLPNA